MEENKNQEITNFIKFLIESTSIYKVNENNLVISRSDDDLIDWETFQNYYYYLYSYFDLLV